MSAETHQSLAAPPELTYATVCSGIECMSVAAIGLPLRPVFFSEIEPFPCAVLKARYPHVPNLGDMSRIEIAAKNGQTEITNGTTRIRLSRPLDILAGGTPCQDVSIAGRRAGMASGSGTRSSLAFDFVRLARDIRPRFLIWENVAGCIDSKNAPDFLRFADALVQCGYNLAYRVLDAQYVRVDGVERAVPQRRRRVWLVGCLRDDLALPAQILFESDRALGHTPPRRRTGQGFARPLADRHTGHARLVEDAAGCAADAIALDGDKLKPRTDPRAGGNGFGVSEDGAGYTLTATDRHGVAYGATECLTPGHPQTHRVYGADGAWPTLKAGAETSGQDQCSVCVALEPGAFDPYEPGGVKASMLTQNVAMTIINGTCPGHHNGLVQCYKNHAADARLVPVDSAPVMGATHNGNASNNNPLVVSTNSNGEDVAPTLTSTDLVKRVTNEAGKNGGYCIQQAYGINPAASGVMLDVQPQKETSMTLRSHSGGENGVISLDEIRYIVRRLTPVECERLMCLPDGYTVPTGLPVGDPELVSEFQRIFDQYNAIMAEYAGKPAPKPKTAAAVAKWLAAISDPATCPDSPRNKTCGNGWATNQPRWILLNLLSALGIDWQTPYAPGPSEFCSPSSLTTPHPSTPQPCA